MPTSTERRAGYRDLRFATRQRAELDIGLVRAQLLKGRTIDEVERLHAAALATLPARMQRDGRVTSLKAARRLIAELEQHILPDEPVCVSRQRAMLRRFAELEADEQ